MTMQSLFPVIDVADDEKVDLEARAIWAELHDCEERFDYRLNLDEVDQILTSDYDIPAARWVRVAFERWWDND